jgi:predicted nuclease of predicted toxin-antitoxin system
MKLVIDMNMSAKWVGALREFGFEVYHWSDLGPIDAPDRGIMEFAAKDGAVVVTRDLDFSALLAANGRTSPSIVHLSEKDGFERATVERVVDALRNFADDLQSGAIVSISAGRARMRRLPIAGAVARPE